MPSRPTTRRSARATAAIGLTGLVFCATAFAAYPGVSLTTPNIGVSGFGTAFPRLSCPSRVIISCGGTVTIYRGTGKTVLGRARIGMSSNDNPTMAVPLTKLGKRLAQRGVTVTVKTVTHDGNGEYATLTATGRMSR